MATVTTPPQLDDLEALIEEARRRQRRRQQQIGAALLIALLAAGIVVYLVVGRSRGTSTRSPTPSRVAPRRTVPRPQIVFAADRVARTFGEIYRVGLDGRKVDLSRSTAVDVAPAVSPDGRWVAFLSDRGQNAALYAVRLDGRGLRKLSPNLFPVRTGDGLDGTISWSSDGRRLAVVAYGGRAAPMVWMGGLIPSGKVVARGSVDLPALSPDGRLLAYRAQHQHLVLGVPGGEGAHEALMTEIRIVDSAGRTVWRVPGGDRDFAWSKNGRLALSRSATVYVYDERGRRLDSFPGRLFAWSPSGDLASIRRQRLEIRRGGTGSPVASFRTARVLNIEWPEAHRIRISTGNDVSAIDPATGRRSHASGEDIGTPLSPDGSRLALASQTDNAEWLIVARLDGTARRSLVRAPACPESSNFDRIQFASDGLGLVYQTACAEGPANLYAVDPDGAHLRRLTRSALSQAAPSLSPNGRWLAFSKIIAPGECKNCPWRIWVMGSRGQHARPLTRPRENLLETDAGPSWSPDGRRIVFSRSNTRSPTALYVVSRTGGPAHALHVLGGQPAWGPTRIAYVDFDLNGAWTVRPDGSGKRRISSARYVSSLAWSRDGRLAYLAGERAVVHVLGKTRSTFALPLRATQLVWSPNGRRLLLSASKGNEPSELYMLDLRSHRLRQLTFGLGNIAGLSWR